VTDKRHWTSYVRDFGLLTLLLCCLLIWPLCSPPVWYHGEAREGLVVESILRDHNWVLPYRIGELPSKPPLFHWIAAILAKPVGLSDAVLRLPSGVGAWLMAAGTFAMGAALGGRAVGWFAVGALLGMQPVWEAATEARVDMLFAACLSLSLFSFYFWYLGRQSWLRLGCYLAAACAVLAKGPVALVLVGGIIGTFLMVGGETRLLGKLWSWPLVALVVVIDAGWYAAAYRAGGQAFLAKQLLDENVYRFLGWGKLTAAGGSRLSFSMVTAFATQVLPWSLAVIWDMFRWRRGERQDAAGRFLHCWWVVVVVLFTLSAGRRNIYLLPAYPAVALLAGRLLASWAVGDGSTKARQFIACPGRYFRSLAASASPLRLLVTVVVAFDLSLLVGFQIVRLYNAQRKSLAPFAAEVKYAIPQDAPLYAQPDMSGTDILVLEYRLRRRIVRKDVVADGAYYLVRGRTLKMLPRSDYSVLCLSKRRRANVALVVAGAHPNTGPDSPAAKSRDATLVAAARALPPGRLSPVRLCSGKPSSGDFRPNARGNEGGHPWGPDQPGLVDGKLTWAENRSWLPLQSAS